MLILFNEHSVVLLNNMYDTNDIDNMEKYLSNIFEMIISNEMK